MAAFLQIARPHEATSAAETIARLRRTVQATLDRYGGVRPTLVCRWLLDPDGRLSCHWDIEPPAPLIPPD